MLDGLYYDKSAKQWVGNALVQKFDADGNWISQFSIRNAALGDADAPGRMAIDGAGRFYITKSAASKIEQYDSTGKLLKTIDLPGAAGVAVSNRNGAEVVVAIGGTSAVVDRKRVMLGGDAIAIIDPATGQIQDTIKLDHPLNNVQTIEADSAGKLYVLADSNQLYQFDSAGKLLQVIGSGSVKPRSYDGSQLSAGLTVTARGDVVAGSWGDPIWFDSGFQTVTRRPGRFNIGTGLGKQCPLRVRSAGPALGRVLRAQRRQSQGRRQKEQILR